MINYAADGSTTITLLLNQCVSESFMSEKEPYMSAKESYMSAKEPYMSA